MSDDIDEEQEGGCINGEDHHWVYEGSAPDGTSFYHCSRCGIESEGM